MARRTRSTALKSPEDLQVCPDCGRPSQWVEKLGDYWSGHPDPNTPDTAWIDDETGEKVDAETGEREAP